MPRCMRLVKPLLQALLQLLLLLLLLLLVVVVVVVLCCRCDRPCQAPLEPGSGAIQISARPTQHSRHPRCRH